MERKEIKNKKKPELFPAAFPVQLIILGLINCISGTNIRKKMIKNYRILPILHIILYNMYKI